jgi:hypothetical protein
MIRRKLISAALFFALFGVIAFMPPFVLVFRTNLRLFGVPLDTIYVFSLWVGLIIGAWWFSRLLPDDSPSGPSKPVDRK